jgi:lipocalin
VLLTCCPFYLQDGRGPSEFRKGVVECIAKYKQEAAHEPLISVMNKTRTPDGRKLFGSASSDWMQVHPKPYTKLN